MYILYTKRIQKLIKKYKKYIEKEKALSIICCM